MVVDDEVAVLETLERQLRRSGHVVHVAHNAAEAIETLGSHEVDVALVDLVMPGKGGLTLIMENLSSKPDLMVVAMSGRLPVGTDSMKSLGGTLGISCYLGKPFTQEELDRAIATALARSCA